MTAPTVLAVLQARLSSTRLPGKVLADVEGEPMIVRQLERIRRSREIDDIVIATSDDPSDDVLVGAMESRGETVRRGPLADVYERFARVVTEFDPRVIVRLTADCPLADPDVVDLVVRAHLDSNADYTSNVLDRTFPHGLDVECVDSAAFRRLGESSLTEGEREHVTLGIYGRPEEYRLQSVRQDTDRSALRWTVDYPQDLVFVRRVYEALVRRKPDFRSVDVLDLLHDRPDLRHTAADAG